jgi:hypothetical protein
MAVSSPLILCLLLGSDPASLESVTDEDPQITFRRALYDFSQGNYGAARARLEALLNPPQLASEEDLIEARKTLGTLYFLKGEERKAREQFELVLLVKYDAELDIYATAPPVLRFFDLVRAETRTKSSEVVHIFELRKNRFEAPRIIERRQIKHNEILAFLPFGIGQFQNGNIGLGFVFLSAEVLMIAANVLGYIAGQELAKNGIVPRALLETHNAWLAVQYSGLGAFAALWAAGAIHARINFKPIVTVDHDITPDRAKKMTVGMQLSIPF